MSTQMWDAICSLVLEDKKLTPQEISEALQEKGIKPPSNITISTVRSDFLSTLRFLEQKGMLKRSPRAPDVQSPQRPAHQIAKRRRFRKWNISG